MASTCDGYLICLLLVCRLKSPDMLVISSDEIKTYDHSACDIKVKIVIDFSI
jgi:hypothetical protein